VRTDEKDETLVFESRFESANLRRALQACMRRGHACSAGMHALQDVSVWTFRAGSSQPPRPALPIPTRTTARFRPVRVAPQVGAYEYNLMLNVDYGTSKHTQWFYFQVKRAPRMFARCLCVLF
jgi:hypothetical protein